MGRKRKGLLDPLAPKKPLTSFMEFAKHERGKEDNDLGSFLVGDGSMGKELGRRWHALSKEERSIFEERSKVNMKMYSNEVKKQKQSSTGTEVPKKPLSSYIEFAKEERIKVKEVMGTLSIPEMGRELGKRWKSLPVDLKEVFEDRSKKNQKKYEEEMLEYIKKFVENDARTASNEEVHQPTEEAPATDNSESPPSLPAVTTNAIETEILAADLGFAKTKGYTWHPALKTGSLASGTRITVLYFGTAQSAIVDKGKWLQFTDQAEARISTPRLRLDPGFKKGLDQLKLTLAKIISSGEQVSRNSGVGFAVQPVGRKLVKLSKEGLKKDEEQNQRFMQQKIVQTGELPLKWKCLDCSWRGRYLHKAKSHARDCGSRKKEIPKKPMVRKYECSGEGCTLAFPLLSQLNKHYRY